MPTKIHNGADAVSKLKGYTLRIPDPTPWYASLPSGFSSHYQRLGVEVDQMLAIVVPDLKMRRKAQKIDIAFLACTVFPFADFDALVTFAYYTAWIFLWDDETDQDLDLSSGAPPTIATDMSLGDEYRVGSLRYIAHTLGVTYSDGDSSSESDSDSDSDPGLAIDTTPSPPTLASGLFVRIGWDMRERCSEGEIRKFWDHLRRYVDATGVEQEMRLAGRFPGLREFWGMRYWSGGVFLHLALGLTQYASKASLRLSDLDESVQAQFAILEHEFNRNVLIMNDIFSLKKEMAENTVINLIPIAIADADDEKDETVVSVVESIVADFEGTVVRFAEASRTVRQLIHQQQLPGEEAVAVEKHLHTIEAMLSGFLLWTLQSDRYGMKKYAQKDGSFSILL